MRTENRYHIDGHVSKNDGNSTNNTICHQIWSIRFCRKVCWLFADHQECLWDVECYIHSDMAVVTLDMCYAVGVRCVLLCYIVCHLLS